ncbi:MAG: DUF4412 domain-containing protein [Bacteroidota bacterium]
MKKYIQLCAFVFIATIVSAQTKLTQGVAHFDITYPTLTKEMKEMESMLPKKLTAYFKKEHSRLEMPMAMGTTVTIGDNTKKEVTVLMDMMGSKFAIHQTADDIKKKEEELRRNGKFPEFNITYSKETKVIAGYKCKKAIVDYTMGGKSERLECYYTEDLPKILGSNDNPAFKDIDGFLMEYNISQSGMKMVIKAKSVESKNVDDVLFIIPSDYPVMSQEEATELMMNGKGGDK